MTDGRSRRADQLARGAANAANGLHLAREGLLDGAEDVREGAMRASGRYAAAPVQMVPDARLDARGASALEKSFARNRSAVMARHLQSQGEMEDGFERMRMDDAEMSARAQMAHNAAMLREMQRGDRWARGFQQPFHAQASPSSWAEEFANVETSRHAQWANEFQSHQPPPHAMHAPPRADAWAQEYRSNQGARWGEEFGAAQNRWADEFSQQHAGDVQAPLTDVAAQTAKQSSELAATLNADPKFANSKFAQLMSKLGSGQVVVREDGLQEVNAAPQARHMSQGERWAAEFVEQTQQLQPQWADQFTAQMQRQNPTSQAWAQQFSQSEMESQRQSSVDDWAEEFKNAPREWASEFEDMQRNNPEWMQNVWDEMQQNPLSERSNYRFTDPNPYLGQSDLQEKTMELAKTGVLAEAALAAEAWVRQDQSNSEAWYHLGRIQAENDDDQQAIAAMSKAYEANPQNPNVLLALAVSHANELDQDEALGHAREWLGSQERFKHIAAATSATHARKRHGDVQRSRSTSTERRRRANCARCHGASDEELRRRSQRLSTSRRFAPRRPLIVEQNRRHASERRGECRRSGGISPRADHQTQLRSRVVKHGHQLRQPRPVRRVDAVLHSRVIDESQPRKSDLGLRPHQSRLHRTIRSLRTRRQARHRRSSTRVSTLAS